MQIKGERAFHTKVKQKNLFNVTLGIRGTGVKQTCRTNFEGLLQEKHVCECVPSHLHIQYVLLGQLGENRKLEIFSVGIRWKNVNHSKQNTARLPADLLKCQRSLGSTETQQRTSPAARRWVGSQQIWAGAPVPRGAQHTKLGPGFPKPDLVPVILGTQRQAARAQAPGTQAGRDAPPIHVEIPSGPPFRRRCNGAKTSSEQPGTGRNSRY